MRDNSWYGKLLKSLYIPGTKGEVLLKVSEFISLGKYCHKPEAQKLDPSLVLEVTDWFKKSFAPFFLTLTVRLELLDGANIFSSAYVAMVNETILALDTARAYYIQKADTAIVTSLRQKFLHQASVCLELSDSIIGAYQTILIEAGKDPILSIGISEADLYVGPKVDTYRWTKKTIVNHKKFELMENTNSTQSCESGKKDFLPWVFCAAFGLIAWTAAASKNTSNSKS